MKRLLMVLIVVGCVGIAAPAQADAGELRITVRADWMFTIRAGIEYRFGRYFGLQTSIGTNTQVLVADVLAAVYATPPESAWQCALLLGIPNASMPFSFDAGFISFGGVAQVSYRFSNDIGLDFRIGEGFPLFFEEGKDMIRDVGFPFGLWPDLGIGVSFPR